MQYSISMHKCIMCPPCDTSTLCFANPETWGAQRFYLPHVTFVHPLLAKSLKNWTCHQPATACKTLGSPFHADSPAYENACSANLVSGRRSV